MTYEVSCSKLSEHAPIFRFMFVKVGCQAACTTRKECRDGFPGELWDRYTETHPAKSGHRELWFDGRLKVVKYKNGRTIKGKRLNVSGNGRVFTSVFSSRLPRKSRENSSLSYSLKVKRVELRIDVKSLKFSLNLRHQKLSNRKYICTEKPPRETRPTSF